MNDLIPFAQQHLTMVIAWCALMIAIVVTEWLNKQQKAPQVSPQSLVELMNNQLILQ